MKDIVEFEEDIDLGDVKEEEGESEEEDEDEKESEVEFLTVCDFPPH